MRQAAEDNSDITNLKIRNELSKQYSQSEEKAGQSRNLNEMLPPQNSLESVAAKS